MTGRRRRQFREGRRAGTSTVEHLDDICSQRRKEILLRGRHTTETVDGDICVMNPSNQSIKQQGDDDLLGRPASPTEIATAPKGKKTGSKYRTGKWTEEETMFASQIIRCFGLGIVKLPPNKTLRTHLSAELDCDPMRITKKFPGTALLMKEVSDDSKTQAPQSVAQNALLKLNSLKLAFQDSLQTDRQKKDSRLMVFSLLDDIEDADTPQPPALCSPPAGADNAPKTEAKTHDLSPQRMQGEVGITAQAHDIPGDIQNAPPQEGASSDMQLDWMNANVINAPAQAMPGPVKSTLELSTALANTQNARLQEIQGSVPTQPTAQSDDLVAKGHRLQVLLEAATPGSPLAGILSNPTALDELWKMQQEQEELVGKRRASLMRLSSSPPTITKDTSQAPPSAPPLVVTMNNFTNSFVSNTYPSPLPAPTMNHSHSAPNLPTSASYCTPQQAVVAPNSSPHSNAPQAQFAFSASPHPNVLSMGNPNVSNANHCVTVANTNVNNTNNVPGVVCFNPFFLNPVNFPSAPVSAPANKKPDAVDAAAVASHHAIAARANPSILNPQMTSAANPFNSNPMVISLPAKATAPDVTVDALNAPSDRANPFLSSGAGSSAADSSEQAATLRTDAGEVPQNTQVPEDIQENTPDWLDKVMASTR